MNRVGRLTMSATDREGEIPRPDDNEEKRTMSELRAPDPTLDAMGDRWAVVSIEDGAVDGPATAHEMDPGAGCDPADGFGRTWARYAKWFAVPCRKCFPDAPPPCWDHIENVPLGRRAHRSGDLVSDVALAWQVPGR